MANTSIDGILIHWGDRLFYPSNRLIKSRTPRLELPGGRAAEIRSRIEATVRRAPQVMVKVTGGGRGMAAIGAHFRYISKNGRLDIEDDRGSVERGKEALHELERQWRVGGAQIDAVSPRREAFNVMLSMPRGTDPLTVQWAAREFARVEFADHRYVIVLHDHQANPHVHLSVRAASKQGKRLNPRKADLQRWRETFAERLRERGIDAEASPQITRGGSWRSERLWQRKAKEGGRLNREPDGTTATLKLTPSRHDVAKAWSEIAKALAASDSVEDRRLARRVVDYARHLPGVRYIPPQQQAQRELAGMERGRADTRNPMHNSVARTLPQRSQPEPDLER
jgi:hypothetical protein